MFKKYCFKETFFPRNSQKKALFSSKRIKQKYRSHEFTEKVYDTHYL